MGMKRLIWSLFGVAMITALAITAAHAEQIWAGGYGRTPPRFPTPTTFSGGFNFCRVMFQSDHREKQGWGTDYPGADINFSIRLAELTKVQVKMSEGTEYPEPDAVVVRLTDDALFQCPVVFMEDAGTARFSDIEVSRLQDYLLKGGFLLAMDYHGMYGRDQFDEEMARVLPPARFPIVDLTPPSDHVIWRAFFNVNELPQMASINTWRRTGDVIERWNDTGAAPTARGIADGQGRLMVLMVHNTDLPDPWEREGEDRDYFFKFSPEAYAVGIDILIYAMTH
jgi:hypothetical protein